MSEQGLPRDGHPDALDGGVDGIAVIGVAGRFPGAATVDQFWRNLCGGVDSISRFSDAELEDSFGPEVRVLPNFVRAHAVLDDADLFDAGFFGMYPREAELTDPQHRLFLECAWEALEDSGYDPFAYPGAIGVFAGCSIPTYFLRQICTQPGAIEGITDTYQVGGYPTLVGAAQDFLATKISYKLDLRGPSVTSLSACSTSLLCVAQACQSLLLYQADMALAGGVSISFPQRRGYLHQEGGMVSADGTCRTFDAEASGTVFGSGGAVVLLKRLEDALRDRDHVYAVIRGFGINNDGSAKVGYTAPSVDGQAACIAAAHAMAGVEARSISYVECHGTATPLGDPIELSGLEKAFRASTPERGFCALGSVKTNVGHLDVAAGAAGLIKACLTLEREVIPPTLHFRAPNPRFDLRASPFLVNAALTPWARGDRPRRAGVSAFGVGGTNVHIVLEEAPEPEETTEPEEAEAPQLIVLSARSATALAEARTRLAARLRQEDALRLEDTAFTLQAGRRSFAHRAAIVAESPAAAAEALEQGAGRTGSTDGGEPALAFMFPGQGSQHLRMGLGLYRQHPVFREAIDACAARLEPDAGFDLRGFLYPDHADDAAAERLTATAIAQPVIFAVEYALAALWRSWGLRPRATIGHSVGEFVSACLAGVMSLEDALGIVAARGRLMQDLPGGAMLAVRLPEAELAAQLPEGAAIAAVNGPSLGVAAGPCAAIEVLEASLAAQGVMARRLHTSHAFHSPMIEPIVEPLRRMIEGVELSAPRSPYLSSVTGTWITAAEATSPEYWARHAREPVRFHAGLLALAEDGITALLEVGPGQNLTALAMQAFARRAGPAIIPSLPVAAEEGDERRAVLDALGHLWALGAQPDWSALHAGRAPRRVPLPTYPFERQRYWIEPEATRADATPPARPLPPEAPLPAPTTPPIPEPATAEATSMDVREVKAGQAIAAIFEELSGENITGAPDKTFLELGFDSLFLSQVAQKIQIAFGVKVTFRQLLGDLSSLAPLARHVLAGLPPTAFQDDPPGPPAPITLPSTAPAAAPQPSPDRPAQPLDGIEGLMRDQLRALSDLINRQLDTLKASSAATLPAVRSPAVQAPPPPKSSSGREEIRLPAAPKPVNGAAAGANGAGVNRFEALKGGRAAGDLELTPDQARHVADLVARYERRTPGSKAFTERHRGVLADPRAVSGFRPEWKEMVYPIVTERSSGSRLWDVDGNEYVDFLNGFGPTFLGHASDLVVEAVRAQLAKGFEIGPQTVLAGSVAELVRELTGNERVTFCNTGSEAVMAAMRVARCVTGRDRVVMFSGSYHGQFDEVLVRAGRPGSERALPVAPGIPAANTTNMTVLDYGTPEALDWLRGHASELAAVIVEPVQSRHPGLRPEDFLRELRAITEETGTALVFDEVVTGFRIHPGGMQAVFGIRADLATYGKVAGGGLPIGILAGRARFMDALDGGAWRYGDDSAPEVGVTFVAGTFVRHPLALAAAQAVLEHLRRAGPALQEDLARRTEGFVARLNALLAERGVASRIESYGSLFYLNFAAEDRLSSLLYHHLRLRGIHVQEGFPSFLTTAHSEADLERFVAAFRESLDELGAVGILRGADPGRRPGPTHAPAPGGAERRCGAMDGVPASPPLTEAPLTEAQMEVWLSAQLGGHASCAFNESVSLTLQGRLDVPALGRALDAVVARHDALRTRFSPAGDKLLIAPSLHLDLALTDLQHLPQAAAEREVQALVERDAETPFSLVEGPLARVQLLRLAAEEHVLVFTAHHIICDGWSINLIVHELAELYAAEGAALGPMLDEALPFSRYAVGEAAARDGEEAAAAQRYWLDQFRDVPPPLELPTDWPRPGVKSGRGATAGAVLPPDLMRSVRKAGAGQGSTLFATLFAAFQVLIGRLAEQRDVVIAVPFAGQALVEDRALVGHCVNFLPLRARWAPETSFAEHLAATKAGVIEAREHQHCTLGTVVRRLGLARDLNRPPLTGVQFNLERLADDVTVPGLRIEVAPNPKRFVNFDLFFNLIESEDGLRVDCDYSTDLFDEATILRWIGHYRTLLEAVVRDPRQPVATLPLLSEEERRRLLVDANANAMVLPPFTVLDLIADRSKAAPDRVALAFGAETLTYGALEARANRLAHHLAARVPAPAGSRLGVLVERSPEMVVALLAVMKAGHAYVPLEPGHPPARLGRILEDAGVAALLTAGVAEIPPLPPGATVIDLPAEADAIAARSGSIPPVPVGPGNAAYAIYTSGSTGLPKGVEVPHGALANFLASMLREPGLGAEDALLAATTLSFDIAGLELFLPLCAGARVVIAPGTAVADTYALLALLRESKATVMQATPSRWRLMIEAGFRSWPGLKMLCGGEAVSGDVVDALVAGGGELWNMYGPTETTIWSSTGRLRAGEEPITIGRPIANTQMYVLDGASQPVVPGQPGELHIGGAGLARGYLNRPDLTAAAFVPNPFAGRAGERLYRTGDRASWLPDGHIQLLGRLDQQVKLRGFRIELGEIEAVLARKAGLAASAVLLREDVPGDKRLVGYFVAAPGARRSPADLRELLAEELPDYMIPTAWVALDAMPFTPNGKLDRRLLPRPEEVESAEEATPYVAPSTPLETRLAGLWTEVLGHERIGVQDDIYDLGADSIKVFQITARAIRAGITLNAADILKHRTISALAAAVEQARPAARSLPPLVAVARENYRAGPSRPLHRGHLR